MTPYPGAATCNLCDPPSPVTLQNLIDHLRIEHGEVIEIETWPDGSPVVVDTTLEPHDFGESV